jgi:hypothetical protein
MHRTTRRAARIEQPSANGRRTGSATTATRSRRSAVDCLFRDPMMTRLELHESLVASGSGISTVLVTAYPDETTRLRAQG